MKGAGMEEQRDGDRPWARRETPYQKWQQGEAIPTYKGSYVGSLYDLDLKPWARVGQPGAFVNLAEQEEDDGWVVEIAPGGNTEVLHHMFEALVYVLSGRGATTFWQPDRPKQTVEWQRGSVFSPPINSHYQHFNLDGQQPARLFAVTNAPMVMNLLRNTDFAFDDAYVFRDRYDGEESYFTDPGHRIGNQNAWKTNFIPDIRGFKLDSAPGRGAGGFLTSFSLANNAMAAHCSEFPPGTYKKGHQHGVGAHVIILDGQGYSLLWFEGEERRKVDWKPGSVVSPKEMEYHQHFNTGPTAARYLALRLGELDTRREERARRSASGDERTELDGIPYELEDPTIYDLYVEECTKNGATVVLPRPQYAKL